MIRISILILTLAVTLTSAFAKGGGRTGQLYTATIFADSAAGNDANNGLTPATPKKTLAAVRGLTPGASAVIGLKRGSVWHEGLYGLPAGCSIIAYGTGKAPVIDSSDRATAWTATSGKVNVWETPWTFDTSYSNADGFAYAMLWDGETQLPGAASVAACESTAGSFYHDTVVNKVYYHASDNGDPRNKAIYITKRPEGIYQYTAAGNSANGITIDGIRCRRSYVHYGSISNGVGGTTRNCIVDGGGIHHMVLATGTTQDNVYLETSPRHTEGTVPLAVYQPTGVGSSATVTRLFMVGSLATKSIQGSLYTHTSSDPSTSYDSVTYDQCYGSYGRGFDANSTGGYTVSNSFAENGTMGVNLGAGTTPTVSRCLFKNCSGASSSKAIISDAGPVSTVNQTRTISNTVIYLSDNPAPPVYGVRVDYRQGSLTLTNCVIYMSGNAQEGAAIYARSNGPGNGLTLTVNNCIIVVPWQQVSIVQRLDANVTYVGDHNVFAQIAPTQSNLPFDGAQIGGLTAWRTATGQDAHSVYLSASQFATFFSGNVANGDFRINASNAVTDANGTIYTGQFPDATALSTVGVQSYYNWNTRAVVNTAPVAWPVPPQTLAQANTYTANPLTWNFYP